MCGSLATYPKLPRQQLLYVKDLLHAPCSNPNPSEQTYKLYNVLMAYISLWMVFIENSAIIISTFFSIEYIMLNTLRYTVINKLLELLGFLTETIQNGSIFLSFTKKCQFLVFHS